MSNDKHLTTQAFESMMLLLEFDYKHSLDYLDRLLIEGGTIANILSISASDLEAKLPAAVGTTEVGICNVSKVLETFLKAAFGVFVPSVDFTERELLLFEIFNSSKILGVTKNKLNSTAILPETYMAIPELLGDRPQPTRVSPVKTCGVCYRMMKSVHEDEGVCSSCKGLLKSFTPYRIESFYLPINHLNIPNLAKKGSEGEPTKVCFISEDWLFESNAYGITATLFTPIGKQKELPIIEYQKPIY